MSKITVYLSGPMYLGKEQATAWRNEVIKYIDFWSMEHGHIDRPTFKILNPCNRWREKGGDLESEGSFVVQMDKIEIAKSDVVIVNATYPGWGTPMEQYIAWESGKMVICFSDCDYPSIWAIVHSHKMVRTHIDAADYLCNVVAKQLARVV